MTAAGIAIRDSRILEWVGVAALGLTIIIGVSLAVHGVFGAALAASAVASLRWIKGHNQVTQIWLLANGDCELTQASSSHPVVATIHSSFDAFGLVILLIRGSFPALLMLAPDSIEIEQRRLLGLWLKSHMRSPARSGGQ